MPKMKTTPIGSAGVSAGTNFADIMKHLRAAQVVGVGSIANNDSPTGVPSSAVASPSAPVGGFKHGDGTLYYGGTPANTPYLTGCKPSAQTTFRKQKRFELIARMENAGLPEAQMAPMLGLSISRLKSIKQRPEYLKARMAITLGIIIDTDASLEQIREQRKAFLVQMLPPALQVIANVVNTPPANFGEKRLQVAVAQDILDREGTYAKISRTEVKPVEHFDWETSDAAAASALSVIKGTLRVSQSEEAGEDARQRIEKIIEITSHFSAGKTPSPEAQQEALRALEEGA